MVSNDNDEFHDILQTLDSLDCPFKTFYCLVQIKTSWAELGLTQAETVSLELKLNLTLFKS